VVRTGPTPEIDDGDLRVRMVRRHLREGWLLLAGDLPAVQYLRSLLPNGAPESRGVLVAQTPDTLWVLLRRTPGLLSALNREGRAAVPISEGELLGSAAIVVGRRARVLVPNESTHVEGLVRALSEQSG
jgi:hypothetical protein